MLRTDFNYDLPPELIAQAPLPERSAGRMLVLDRETGAIQDRLVRELPAFLAPGDLLVLNDTRVVAARIFGTKPSGGRVEILLERAVAECEALVQLRASKPIREGLQVITPGGVFQVIGRENDLWRIRVPAPVLDFFERWGQMPLPPYIQRPAGQLDQQRYQTIFARELGAVAAPTASLHFDEALLEELKVRGVSLAFVTLHVGAGTFQPLREDDVESHVMHAERATVGAATCEAVKRARAAGRRVIAAGTTVVRALESAALNAAAPEGAPEEPGAALRLEPWSGETRLFIKPGFRFRVVDALLTNFHLPESTLLMLVCALAGREPVLAAYRHAVKARYRFFSYGDAMLLTTGVSA
ncbi:MAG TPA: tRNA preQ1(34) S-adenosylmethionine ribosyltransferase-isomerase QueA [Steroidobacteraceae bacterium]|nr:tRNA preQ1(34) S-adenosylmethionine ribosyltransferase-isomerase QueA [Steroidobacteraceae bacterium]